MKCLYHRADFDGQCAGAIVKQRYPYCEMIGINYGDDFDIQSLMGEEVFIVDFSFSAYDMNRINSTADLIWIDHHKTAMEDMKSQYIKGVREIGKGACELTWNYFYPMERMPLPVWYLSKYDIWDHSEPDILNFQYGLRLHEDTSPDNMDLWSNFLNNTFEQISLTREVCVTGKKILKYEKNINKKYCESYAFRKELFGYRCLCINKGMSNSKVFDSIVTDDDEVLVTFCLSPSGRWNYSLYSTKEYIDCGEIAKKYDGGGHKGAAGFQSGICFPANP